MNVRPILLAFASLPVLAQPYAISLFAGGGFPPAVPGASLGTPAGIATDNAGNVYFAQPDHNVVLRLDGKTGLLALAAGNGTAGFSGDDGLAVNAQLNNPVGVAVDSAGNLFISESVNRRVRKVTNGVITTIAGGGASLADNVPATSASLYSPQGIAVDSAGNLYIADLHNLGDPGNAVRKVTFTARGAIITTAVFLEGPYSVAVDLAGNLYVISGIHRDATVFKVSGGQTQILASVDHSGALPDPAKYLIHPQGIAVDSGGKVYVSDNGHSRVVTLSGGGFTTIAGTGGSGYMGDNGPAVGAQLDAPNGIALDPSGNLYIADKLVIRRIAGGVITTVAGSASPNFGDGGPAKNSQLSGPFGVGVDGAGNVYLSDTVTGRIRSVASGSGTITTLAELSFPPFGIAADPAGKVYVANPIFGQIGEISGGVVANVAGMGGFLGALGDNGPATSAHLNHPYGVAVDSAGNLYIADTGNNRIREVSGGIVTTIAGNGAAGFVGDGGPATSAQLNAPNAVAVDSSGDVFIADTVNKRVRKVSAGVISTVAGGGLSPGIGDNGPATSAQLSGPGAVAVDSAGIIYFTDGLRVRAVSGGTITTIAGGGTSPAASGIATDAVLTSPQGLAVDSAGNVYFADYPSGSTTGVIRLLTPNPVPHIANGGIVPVYSSTPVIQPGSWASIYGNNLASGTSVWNGDFPTSLGGVSVTINNKPAYLWFVSPTQINLQAPDDQATGMVSVVVTTPTGTSASTVTLAPQSPSFSLLGDGKHVAAEILTSGGAWDLVGPTNTFSFHTRPVKPGETLVLYGVGFGPTTPPVSSGGAFSGSAPANGVVAVTIGDVKAAVSYVGITQAGLYQLNVTVPQVASGDQPLQAVVNGVRTPAGPVVAVQ